MAHTVMTPDGRGAGEIEIAKGDDHKRFSQTGSMSPMTNGRQALAGELSVSVRFEPTDARNRMLALSFGIGSFLPGGRAGLAHPVSKFDHRFL